MSAQTLLDRLQGVKATAPHRWLAQCPGHQDKSPSLSIRELDDGRVLIHDFGGCDTQAVLEALGLTLADLFEKPLPGTGRAGGFPRTHSRISAADALAALDHELTVASMILADALEDPRTLNQANLVRLAQCARRIAAARDLINPLEARRA